MRQSRYGPSSWSRCAFALALAGVLGLGPAILASPVAAKKSIPKASRQLKKATLNLMRAKTYTVNATVLGGLAKDEKHKVSTVTVSEDYTGKVLGHSRLPVMEIPKIRAFKTPEAGKGVIYYQGIWKRLLATQTGVKMDRLIDFPTLILAEAAKYSRTARWLEKDEIADGFDFGDEGSGDDRSDGRRVVNLDDGDDDSGEPRGRTKVKEAGKDEDDVKMPRVLRVEAPPRQALGVWIKRVENSGCMKEG